MNGMELSVESLVNMTSVQIYFMKVVQKQTYDVELHEEVVETIQALDRHVSFSFYERYRDSLPSISNPPGEGMEKEIALLVGVSINKNADDTEDE